MLLTVTPNAALDKTYLLEHFAIGRVHRPQVTRVVAGGKGLNVARVTRTLGGEVMATGFLGGHIGGEIREYVAREGIPDRFVQVAGESRLCLAMIDTGAGTQTEVNETGPEIASDELYAFQAMFTSLIPQVDTVAFCGSLPAGLAPGFYRDMILEAKSAGVRTVLDTSGEPLRLGLEAAPDVVKPNAVEVSAILGRDIETVGEAAEAGRDLLAMGVQSATVTLGRCGAVGVDATGAWFSEPPAVDFASAVGSGDSFLAAFLLQWSAGKPLAVALRYGTAAGAANATTVGAGELERHTLENLVPRVSVTAL